MKLLLDENLSDRIVPYLTPIWSGSTHVKEPGLTHTDDALIWHFAKEHGFTIVSKDADFHQRSLLFGHPPKLIYLRIGNAPTQAIIDLLTANQMALKNFHDDPLASILLLSSQ